MYYKRILTFVLPVLFSPHEPVHFLGFFTSWIRIRIQEDFLNADPCGSGSATLCTGTSTCRSYFMFTLEKTSNDVKFHSIFVNY